MTIELISMTTPPEIGRKIVAFHKDGSGARIFIVHGGEWEEADGDRLGPYNGLDRYAYLPDDFMTWTETNNR